MGWLNIRKKLKLFNQDIDILFVSEIHFTNKNYCHIPRFTLYDTVHLDDKAYGGTTLIIRSNIKHYEIGKFRREFLQATSIIVEDQNDCITISVTVETYYKKGTIYNLF